MNLDMALGIAYGLAFGIVFAGTGGFIAGAISAWAWKTWWGIATHYKSL